MDKARGPSYGRRGSRPPRRHSRTARRDLCGEGVGNCPLYRDVRKMHLQVVPNHKTGETPRAIMALRSAIDMSIVTLKNFGAN
jgi:hypothetical protein